MGLGKSVVGEIDLERSRGDIGGDGIDLDFDYDDGFEMVYI